MSWLWWWSAPSKEMVVGWSSQSPGLNQHTILSFVVQDPCSQKMSTLFSQATLWCLEASKQWGVKTLYLLFFTLPSIFFSFFNNSLPYYLTRSCQILEMSLTTKECALAALLLVLDQVIVRNEFGHHLYIQKQFCYQILILISHKLIFSGRTSSGFCFRKPPLHFHHRPVLAH